MKKILASILTLALLVGILPAALGTGSSAAAAPKALKVLTIGDKFTRSGMEYLYKILDAEGYTDIVVANSYLDGATLTQYAGNTTGGSYRYNTNRRDYWDIAASISLEYMLKDEEWDCIILQTNVDAAADAAALTSAVNSLVPYIKSINSKAKIGLHVNWAKDGNTAAFAEIVEAAQKTILDSGRIDFALPVGTVMMNVQTSFMETIYKDFKTWKTDANGERVGNEPDNANLNRLGELIASNAWYALLYGKKLDELKYEDAWTIELSSAERKVILEAINNAMDTPFAITKSAYPTEPTQYTAVVVNDQTCDYMAGDTVSITAATETTGQRKFRKWVATKGNVTFANPNAITTTFKMPAEDVEIKAVYEGEQDVQFKMGFGRADVHPDKPINLAGNFDVADRLSVGNHPDYPEDRLTMSAIALSDGTNTHIVMTTDFIRVPTSWHKQAEEAVYEKYGKQYNLDEFCLTMSATHTHGAPDIGDGEVGVKQKSPKYVNSFEGGKNTWFYHDFWLPGVLESVGKALEDLTPVRETRVDTAIIPGMSYVRHWRYGTSEGVGVVYGITTRPTFSGGANKGFFHEGDHELQIVNFVRDNADDIVLMNYQGHADASAFAPWDNSEKRTIMNNGKETEYGISHWYLSADYPGFAVRYVEENYKDDEDRNVKAAYFLGASGNMQRYITMNSVAEKYDVDAVEKNKWGRKGTSSNPDVFGWELGEHTVDALETTKKVATGEVKTMRQQFIGVEYLYDLTREMQQDVITVGPSIAFVTGGYEMFSTHGEYIKENSPYEITFILTSTQGHEYMPDWQIWNASILGGPVLYEENYELGCVNVAPGIGDDLADSLVAMLNVVHDS